jgi:hypothetical protein
MFYSIAKHWHTGDLELKLDCADSARVTWAIQTYHIGEISLLSR